MNVVVLTKQLSHIVNSPIGDIVIGGSITPIVEHIGYPFNKEIEFPLVGRSRCDMEYHMNMGVIYHDGNS